MVRYDNGIILDPRWFQKEAIDNNIFSLFSNALRNVALTSLTANYFISKFVDMKYYYTIPESLALPTQHDIDNFDNNGFWISSQVVSLSQVEDAKRKIAELFQSNGAPSGPSTLRKIVNSHKMDEQLSHLVSKPQLSKIASMLLKVPKVKIWFDEVLEKPQEVSPSYERSAHAGWHQDLSYLEKENCPDSRVITAWVALDDMSIHNSCLLFLPKSHKSGLYSEDEIAKIIKDGEKDIFVANMKAGEISFHHSLTIHTSSSNNTMKSRVAIAVRFLPDVS